MEKSTPEPATVDAYIAGFPEEIQGRLEALRATIRAVAPEAVERISYQMPTFTLHGNLVYFAAWKRHIGFYSASEGLEVLNEELAPYAGPKGSLKFPHEQPLPLELIARIVQIRVVEDRKHAAAKAAKKRG